MSTGYLTEDGYYYAPGAVVGVIVRSKCRCGCHSPDGPRPLHFTACCVADPPAGTPVVPAVGNPVAGAEKILYGTTDDPA
jgi:hypothetical protein